MPVIDLKILVVAVLLLAVTVHPAPRCDLGLVLDCEEIYEKSVSAESGVYTIYPGNSPVKVYCDMHTDGGKWTVILRRVDGTVTFYRPWAQYTAGFGDASSEYWLGLENMHLLTKNKTYHLRVDMEDFEGNAVFAFYSTFSVGPEADGYRLQVAGFKNGGSGDSLAYHNGMKFTTFDKDQDRWHWNCAYYHWGGFWYNKCQAAHLTGVYLWGRYTKHGSAYREMGIVWNQWKGNVYSLKTVAMKIRRAP